MELWEQVDAYLDETIVRPDEALAAAQRAADEAGLPSIAVTPGQGKLLHVLARAIGARRILEVGTLGGYSTIWLARALPADGRLTTLEISREHADVATASLARAGVGDRVDVLVGPAADTLPTLDGPYDFTFVDADKPNNPVYFREAVRLTRPGGLIVVDNVIRRGGVVDPDSADPAVQGTRALFAAIAAEPRVTATAVQTVGAKGHDGLAVLLVHD